MLSQPRELYTELWHKHCEEWNEKGVEEQQPGLFFLMLLSPCAIIQYILITNN